MKDQHTIKNQSKFLINQVLFTLILKLKATQTKERSQISKIHVRQSDEIKKKAAYINDCYNIYCIIFAELEAVPYHYWKNFGTTSLLRIILKKNMKWGLQNWF